MVLKLAGVAFAATSYFAMIGWYFVGLATICAIALAAAGTVRLLDK